MDLIKIHRHISPQVQIAHQAYLLLLYRRTVVGVITLVAYYWDPN